MVISRKTGRLASRKTGEQCKSPGVGTSDLRSSNRVCAQSNLMWRTVAKNAIVLAACPVLRPELHCWIRDYRDWWGHGVEVGSEETGDKIGKGKEVAAKVKCTAHTHLPGAWL